MLCITMEVEPRTAKQYKCHHCGSCKKLPGKGDGGWKKVFESFLWKKCVLGHPIAQATSYCLLPDSFWLQASKYAFKVGSVKFANSLSPPSIVKKVRTGSKSSQAMQGKRSRELTTPPESPNRNGCYYYYYYCTHLGVQDSGGVEIVPTGEGIIPPCVDVEETTQGVILASGTRFKLGDVGVVVASVGIQVRTRLRHHASSKPCQC